MISFLADALLFLVVTFGIVLACSLIYMTVRLTFLTKHDAIMRPNGKWIVSVRDGYHVVECSECGYYTTYQFFDGDKDFFCRHCGAAMKGGGVNDTTE